MSTGHFHRNKKIRKNTKKIDKLVFAKYNAHRNKFRSIYSPST